jgi:pyruvate kinase
MVQAGIDVVRMNRTARPTTIGRVPRDRRCGGQAWRTVGILATCRGRRSRRQIRGRQDHPVGEKFILDAQCPLGNQERVGLDYKDCPRTSSMATSCCSTTAA